jgi:hypothetical protein
MWGQQLPLWTVTSKLRKARIGSTFEAAAFQCAEVCVSAMWSILSISIQPQYAVTFSIMFVHSMQMLTDIYWEIRSLVRSLFGES